MRALKSFAIRARTKNGTNEEWRQPEADALTRLTISRACAMSLESRSRYCHVCRSTFDRVAGRKGMNVCRVTVRMSCHPSHTEHRHTHKYMHTHTYLHIHTQIHTHSHTDLHTRTDTHKHIHRNTHTNTHTHTHTYIYTNKSCKRACDHVRVTDTFVDERLLGQRDGH